MNDINVLNPLGGPVVAARVSMRNRTGRSMKRLARRDRRGDRNHATGAAGAVVGAQVSVVGICKRYGGTQALDDVSVEIEAGSVHALVGANGAGKSTLGKIIGGVVRPDDGEMFVDGRAVKYATPREARWRRDRDDRPGARARARA